MLDNRTKSGSSAQVLKLPIASGWRKKRIASVSSLTRSSTEIGKFVGIVSLTELPLSRLMWAHYADSHAGFVAELAAGEEGNYEGFVIRGMGTGLTAAKVKYPRSFAQISLPSDGSNVLEVFWSKHPLWEYELEWRIVAPLAGSVRYRFVSDAGKEQGMRFCVPFKPTNLRRVIFGMRMKRRSKLGFYRFWSKTPLSMSRSKRRRLMQKPVNLL